MKLVSVAEMIAIEKEADAAGHTYEIMMENAGTGLGEVLQARRHELAEASALGLVGTGNNGGDTLVALRHLAEVYDWQVSAYLLKPRPEDPLVQQFEDVGGTIIQAGKDKGYKKLRQTIGDHAVLLDGLLGTGIQLPLRGPIVKLLAAAQETLAGLEVAPLIIAVDCPSGVNCDNGEAAEETLPADITVTMAAVKSGLLMLPALELVGELHLVGIGLPEELESWHKVKREVADNAWVRQTLPSRPLDAHKGTFGTLLVVGGSINFTGAPLLAGKAAYRAGAGLVTLAVPTPLHAALAGQFPEATWLMLPHDFGVIDATAAPVLQENLDRVTAIALGPGFGIEATSREFLETFLAKGPRSGRAGIGFVGAQETTEHRPSDLPPMVIDADGLKLLCQVADWEKLLPAPAVLTPHPGEMAIMTGLEKEQIQEDRIGVAETFAAQWGHVVVLKGAVSVIASPDGRTCLIPVATPALARAGTGDVLTGLIGGLLAQGLAPYEAAVVGGWIHAQAGLEAEWILGNNASVLAGDVLAAISDVLTDLQN